MSVSGDGGYNEVVDGAMRSGNDAVVCAVLPAGNANDHRRATVEQPLADAIVNGSVTRIDLLRLTVEGSSPTTRYAHSYIGLGLTPVVAVDLERGGKGSLKEALTAVRAFANFRPFEIQLEDGPRQRFDNLKQMPIQVDGEVMELAAGAKARIDIAHQVMQTLL